MPLLTIQQNTPTQLVAVQSPGTATAYSIWVLLTAIAVVACALYYRRWWLVIVGIALVVFMIPWRSSQRAPNYEVVVDKSARIITSKTMLGNRMEQTFSEDARDLASAEMQFNRGATRIVLIQQDGQQKFPFGELHYQDEPDQYVVLNAMRQTIGQVPSSEQGH